MKEKNDRDQSSNWLFINNGTFEIFPLTFPPAWKQVKQFQIHIIVISVFIFLVVTGVASAETEDEQTTARKKRLPRMLISDTRPPTTIAKERAAVSQEGLSKMLISDTQSPTAMLEEILDKRKEGLNGTEWSVKLRVMDAGKNKGMTETDVISFSEDKVMSENLADLGYKAAKYSARLKEDGTLIWETMQNSKEDGIAFWRGDIGPDNVMRGVLSKRDLEEKMKNYDFVGKEK